MSRYGTSPVVLVEELGCGAEVDKNVVFDDDPQIQYFSVERVTNVDPTGVVEPLVSKYGVDCICRDVDDSVLKR